MDLAIIVFFLLQNLITNYACILKCLYETYYFLQSYKYFLRYGRCSQIIFVNLPKNSVKWKDSSILRVLIWQKIVIP